MRIASTAMPYAAPRTDCRGAVRPATENRGQQSNAHDPEDQRVPHVADDSTERRDEVEAAVEVVHAEDDAPDALRRCPQRLVDAGHRSGAPGGRGDDHLAQGHDEAGGDRGERPLPAGPPLWQRSLAAPASG